MSAERAGWRDRYDRAAAGVGWFALAVAVGVGAPLFVRMPPWCDLTLYQVASANVQAGGVLYRDVFDTNLPGFIAALAAVRTVFGPSVEAVRLVDLAVVGATLVLLARWVRAAGAGRRGTAWFLAGGAWFYLFTSEFNHCQRDVWMLLPVAVAVALRTRRLVRGGRRTFAPAVVEGVVWGLAVWIKPHVGIPAAVLWVLCAARLHAVAGWRGVVLDALGMLVGGGAVGLAGVALLVQSGTWPHFEETFTFWNAGYARMMWRELPYRGLTQFHYFPPWTYLHVVTIPVAVRSVVDARPWSGRFRPDAATGPVGALSPGWLWDAGPSDAARFARLMLAALYLAWTAQALLIQRGFHYVHVPEIVLLLAVLGTQRWMPGLLVLAWTGVSTALVLGGVVDDQAPHYGAQDPRGRTAAHPGHVSPFQRHVLLTVHPLFQFDRYKQWPACFGRSPTDEAYYRRWEDLAMVRDFFPANDWPELAEVAAELRRRGAGDGGVIAWHDAPHAVYTLVPARPGFRFQHVTAMMSISAAHDDRVWTELEALPPGPRWAVSDLHRVGFSDPKLLPDWDTVGPDMLPLALSPRTRRMFPHDQPAVFRSGVGRGRYVIHELTRPLRRPY